MPFNEPTMKVSWKRALHMAFTETRIGLLQKSDLLLRELNVLPILLLLHAEQAFVPGLHRFFDPEIPDRAGRYTHILQTKLIGYLHRTPRWVLNGKSNHLFPARRRRFIGRTLRDRRPVNQPIEPSLLEGPL